MTQNRRMWGGRELPVRMPSIEAAKDLLLRKLPLFPVNEASIEEDRISCFVRVWWENIDPGRTYFFWGVEKNDVTPHYLIRYDFTEVKDNFMGYTLKMMCGGCRTLDYVDPSRYRESSNRCEAFLWEMEYRWGGKSPGDRWLQKWGRK